MHVLVSVLLSPAATGYLSDMILPGAHQQFGWLLCWGPCGTQTSCQREQLTQPVLNTRAHESTQHLHTGVFAGLLPWLVTKPSSKVLKIVGLAPGME